MSGPEEDKPFSPSPSPELEKEVEEEEDEEEEDEGSTGSPEVGHQSMPWMAG